MKAFTQQEKKAILFLSAFFVVGIIVGKIRNGMFYSYPTSTHQEKSEFKSLDQSVYDDNMETESSESISVHQGLINIHDADKDALITLPKIGPETTKRIIKYRKDYGKFLSVNDLKNKKGIGENTLAQIASLITIKPEEKSK